MQLDLKMLKTTKLKLFLDYDGTLVPLTSRPEDAKPDEDLINLLNDLDRKFPMFLITGRSARDIQDFLDSKFEIIAMHGAQLIHKGEKPRFLPGLEKFVEICDQYYSKLKYLESKFPGLMVINKGGGIQFHYYYLKVDLNELLPIIMENIPPGMELYSGKFVLEYRIKGINKGKAILQHLENGETALFAGDDTTDEEAFELLKDHITIKVGEGETKAKYRVKDYKEFRNLLWGISNESF